MSRRVVVTLGFIVCVGATTASGETWIDDGVAPIPGNDWQNPGWVQPAVQGNQVWNGSYWEPVTNGPYLGGGAVAPVPTVTTTPLVTNVPTNVIPYRGPGVTIALEKEEGGRVAYLIDNVESATIEAGQQQKLTAKGRFEIRFSRGRDVDGRDFGEARYTVYEGTYHFTPTKKGWELTRDAGQPDPVTSVIAGTVPAQPTGPTVPSNVPWQPPPPVQVQPPVQVGPPAQWIVQPPPNVIWQQPQPQVFVPPAVDAYLNDGASESQAEHAKEDTGASQP